MLHDTSMLDPHRIRGTRCRVRRSHRRGCRSRGPAAPAGSPRIPASESQHAQVHGTVHGTAHGTAHGRGTLVAHWQRGSLSRSTGERAARTRSSNSSNSSSHQRQHEHNRNRSHFATHPSDDALHRGRRPAQIAQCRVDRVVHLHNRVRVA